jgi:hypothetical protein
MVDMGENEIKWEKRASFKGNWRPVLFFSDGKVRSLFLYIIFYLFLLLRFNYTSYLHKVLVADPTI